MDLVPKGVYDRKPMPPETRAKISATTKGRSKSDETRARMSAAKMGHEPSIGQWKGENVGYSGVHYRAGVALPTECARADDSCKGRLETALRHDAPAHLVRDNDPRGLYYVGDPADGYMRLCRSHHVRYDGALLSGG
jgi:hypothetical protein